MDCVTTDLTKFVLLSATGIFAGEGITLSYISAPAVRDSADPLPSFRKLYSRGKNLAFSTLLPSVASGLFLYYTLNDIRYLAVAGSSFSVILFTVKYMMKINDALFALKETKTEDNQKAKPLLASWASCQLVRTTLGVVSFGIAMHAILKK